MAEGEAGDRLDAALRVLQLLGPRADPGAVADLAALAGPEVGAALRAVAPTPLLAARAEGGAAFLLCDHNRAGGAYRDPGTGRYAPAAADGPQPSAALRAVEVEANRVLDSYRRLYHTGGVSSAYLADHGADAVGCFAVKRVSQGRGGAGRGFWEASHLVRVGDHAAKGGGKPCDVSSTVTLGLDSGEGFALQASLVSQGSEGGAGPWLDTVGGMIEAHDNKIRSQASNILLEKVKQAALVMRGAEQRKVKTLLKDAQKKSLLQGLPLPPKKE